MFALYHALVRAQYSAYINLFDISSNMFSETPTDFLFSTVVEVVLSIGHSIFLFASIYTITRDTILKNRIEN